MSSTNRPDEPKKLPKGFSRRGFLRGVGVSGGALGTGLLEQTVEAAQAQAKVTGPGAVPMTLRLNGRSVNVTAEPRETLLDVLRNRLDMTAAKRVCDRGTCGACTVIMSGKAVYACTVLAIDAQGKDIQTLEGVAQTAKPHPIVNAFVQNDAQQCGYCTPGFVMASKALLDRSPNPNDEQIKEGLGGNFCRCGTYVGIKHALAEASKQLKGGRNA